MADLRELCWRAFRDGRKEDARRLLAQVQQPHPHCVHWASRHGWLDLCQELVENYNLSPSGGADIFGGQDRPLHLACSSGRVEVVKYLLTLPPVIFTVNEDDGGGQSALDLACAHEHLSVIEVLVSEPSVHMPNRLPSNKFSILSLLSRIRMSGSTEFPVIPCFPVFMAGNTGAGKTTLTAAILQMTQHDHSRQQLKTLTARICASQCSGEFYLKREHGIIPDLSADTGIEIYDLAGHEEYHASHSAIMASLCLESPAVFILMVDLTKREKQLLKEIYKWSNLIEIETSSISASVVVVGSHRDELSSEPQVLATKCEFVQYIAKEALGKQHFAGFVALDSRQLSSENIQPFLTILTKSIKDLTNPQMKKMSFSCHLLHAFLEQVVEAKATSFGSLQELVSHLDTLSFFSEPAMLTSGLGTLVDNGLILFLRNNDCLSSSCIIIDKAQLLREINGTLFAPPSFEEHRRIASNTGIVPVSLLRLIFPHYHEILVAMLTSLQFCRPMEPALLAKIITNPTPESPTWDELLYFPALVSAERPGDLSITKGFGWYMHCTNHRQCLTQRCQDAILLDLTYKHALPYPAPRDLEHPNEKLVHQLRRRCTNWKNGIHWKTEKGTEAVVYVSDENRCVSFLVSSNQECPTDSLELRSSVIDTIRSKQKELCSSVQVHEYLISPSQLSHVPDHSVLELTVFSMEDVARGIRDKKRFVLDTQRKERISLEHLLHFDPYQVLPPTAVQKLFASDKRREPIPSCFFAGKYTLEVTEETAAELPTSPQGALPTSATPTSSHARAAVSQKDATPMEVLSSRTEKLADRVSDPKSFANVLLSLQLLSEEEVDEVISAPNRTPLLQSIMLLSHVEAKVAVARSAFPVLTLCQGLEKMPGMRVFAEDMKKELVCLQLSNPVPATFPGKNPMEMPEGTTVPEGTTSVTPTSVSSAGKIWSWIWKYILTSILTILLLVVVFASTFVSLHCLGWFSFEENLTLSLLITVLIVYLVTSKLGITKFRIGILLFILSLFCEFAVHRFENFEKTYNVIKPFFDLFKGWHFAFN